MTNTELYWIRRGLELSHQQLGAECHIPAQRLRELEIGGERFTRFEQDQLIEFFGKKFIEVRAQEQLSQATLADRVNLPVSTVAEWEEAALRA